MNSQNLTLKIEGSNEIETRILDSLNYQKKHQNYLSVKSEIDSVQHLLNKMGFIENKLKSSKTINSTIYSAQFILNKRYKLLTVFYKPKSIDKNFLKLISKQVLDNHFIINLQDVDKSLSNLNSHFTSQGYPFSSIKLSNITTKDNNLIAALIIDTKEVTRRINNVIIKGYDQFPQSYIKHYLKLKNNQIFNSETIKKKSQKINDLFFAEESKSPEVLFTKDSTKIYLYINKLKSNTFDGFLGFGTNEKSNKLEFNGYIDFNLTNNLNYGESLKILYKGEQNEQKLFEANISLPYLLKSPLGLELEFRIFKKDSSFTTVNQHAKINYQLNSNHKLTAGILKTESTNLLQNSNSPSIINYNSTFLSLSYLYLNRNAANPLFPNRSKINFESNLGYRVNASSKERQNQLYLDGFNIFNLDTKNSIYCRFNSALITSNSYFENELLRLGGINSIRGFEENSLFATFYGVFSTEYRFQFANNLYAHSITDIGYFENKIINLKERLYGYGIGLGFLSNSGLFKINYAFGHADNQPFSLRNYKIQIGFISKF